MSPSAIGTSFLGCITLTIKFPAFKNTIFQLDKFLDSLFSNPSNFSSFLSVNVRMNCIFFFKERFWFLFDGFFKVSFVILELQQQMNK